MAKQARDRICRVVLEPSAQEDRLIPAVYVPCWWNIFGFPWRWAWVRHSYVYSIEAKAKAKTVSLYHQLLKTHEEAVAAEAGNKLAVKEAQSAGNRGWGPVKSMKLGEPEDLVSYDKDAWSKISPIVKRLATGNLEDSRSVRHGPRTPYVLPGDEAAWNQAAKGDPILEANMRNKMTFRPPTEDKGKGKGGGNNQHQGGGKGTTEIPIVMINQPQGKSDSSE